MNIIESFKNKFTQQFPNSMIHVSKASLSDDMVIKFTLAQPEDYPNKIINNDPLYHIIFVIDCNDGKFYVESTLSGLYVNPREEYLAMSCVKTKMRKKTGTPEQVEKDKQNQIKFAEEEKRKNEKRIRIKRRKLGEKLYTF